MHVDAPEQAPAAAPGRPAARRVALFAGGCAVLLVSVYVVLVWLGARRLHLDARYVGAGVSELVRWSVWLGLVMVMALGVLAGHVLEHARRAGTTMDLRAALASAWSSVPVLAALYASPLTFCAVYLLMDDPPRTVADFVLAFLLGFWWQACVAVLRPPDRRQVPADQDTERPAPDGAAVEEPAAAPEEPPPSRPDQDQLPSWLRR